MHWSMMQDKPVISNTGDSQSVATVTSDDFLNWSKLVRLEYPGSPATHLYTNAVVPYYRAPHIFIGMPTRLQRSVYWGNKNIKHDDITDVQLMTSRDGRSFKRWDEAFIRPGPEENRWQRWGGHINGMPAWGIVETRSDFPGAPRELSIYSTEGYFFPVKGCRMRRFTLRIDGFVSVQSPFSGGELLTKPILFKGGELVMNFSTSGAGTIRVEIQDAERKPIEGFALADCPPIRGDTIKRVVSWKSGSDVSRLAGKAVRLRFVMKDADLFSLRFR